MTQSPTPDPSQEPRQDPKGDPTPYELAPEPQPARRSEPRARLDAKPFMDDVDDDADMTLDPEVDRALGRIPVAKAVAEPEASPLPEPLVTPGRGEPRSLAIVGAILTIGAVIAACAYADSRWYAAGLAAAYLTLLHVGTGVLAVGLTAHFQGVPIGRLDLAAGRMFVGVSLFMLILHLRIPGPVWASRGLLTLAACLAYAAIVWMLFRPGKERLRVLLASHAGLAVLLWAVVALHVWASDTGAGAGAAPAAP